MKCSSRRALKSRFWLESQQKYQGYQKYWVAYSPLSPPSPRPMKYFLAAVSLRSNTIFRTFSLQLGKCKAFQVKVVKCGISQITVFIKDRVKITDLLSDNVLANYQTYINKSTIYMLHCFLLLDYFSKRL